jgi:hypothetical protein
VEQRCWPECCTGTTLDVAGRSKSKLQTVHRNGATPAPSPPLRGD